MMAVQGSVESNVMYKYNCEMKPGYKCVQIFQDQLLGMGSFGRVCKAKCDELHCAAKMIREIPLDSPTETLVSPETHDRLLRFERERKLRSMLRHPNIVQFLQGRSQDFNKGGQDRKIAREAREKFFNAGHTH